MAVQSVPAGEIITDNLTVYDQSKFYGDVNIDAFDGLPPTNTGNLYFSFDTNEAGVVTDQSGNGNTGTVSGATWTSEGQVNGAYVFDGTNNYIQASDSDSLDICGAFTITVWGKLASSAGPQALVCKHDDSYARAYVLFLNGNRLECQIGSSGSPYNLYIFRTAGEPVLTNWTHMAVLWDGTPNAGGQIYLNGVPAEMEVTRTTFSGTNIYNSSQPLRVGSKSNGGWFFGGAIDEVRIYDRALSAAEIRALAMGGITNAQFQVSRPTTIKHLVPQGDIDMGTFTNGP